MTLGRCKNKSMAKLVLRSEVELEKGNINFMCIQGNSALNPEQCG